MATLQSYNRILVFGAGAVGGYFGSQLAAAGCNVDFVARGARLAAYQARGLTLSNDDGELVNFKIKAIAAPEGLYDLIIISVKAKDTKDAIKACRKHLSSHGAVLPLQNGVDNTQLLEATFDSSRVVGAVVRSGISVPEPGVVHYKPNPRITIGGINERSRRHEGPLRA
ncbi:MAG: hypothetical protein LBV04_01300, partial [Deferribacteraceae bacterium]|nr:hypothetical protein [Deferribacteraceae bacterium]